MRTKPYNNQWILDHYQEYETWHEMCDAYNIIFGDYIEHRTFKNHCSDDLQLRVSGYNYTKEQENWLRENYPKLGTVCAVGFNKRFNQHRSAHTIKEKCRNMGLIVDPDVRSAINRSNTEQLIACNKSRSCEEGTIRRPSNDYLCIKINGDWVLYHKYLWEQQNGPVPKGYTIIFLDNDKKHIDIDNLACIPRSYMTWMNNGLKSSDPDITKTAIMWCDLKAAVMAAERSN